jgi:hypothetical protein
VAVVHGTAYNSSDQSKTVPYEGRGLVTLWPKLPINTTMYQAIIDGKRVLLEAAAAIPAPPPTEWTWVGRGIQRDADVLCPALS